MSFLSPQLPMGSGWALGWFAVARGSVCCWWLGEGEVFPLSPQILCVSYKYSVQGKTRAFLNFVDISAGGDGSSLPPSHWAPAGGSSGNAAGFARLYL